MTSISQKDTKKQVWAVESPQVPSLSLLHCIDPGSAFSYPNHSYRSLSHCLRTNIFPGAPFMWKSLCSDSYISHPPSAQPTDPQGWYGHKTDEMVQWMERNFMNQKVNKTVAEMEKKK